MLLRAVRAAAVAVLIGWGVLVALSVLGWLAAGSASLGAAVGIGSVLWSSAHLGAVSDGSTTVSLVPLGLVAWPLLVVARCARGLAGDLDDDRSARLDALGGMRRAGAGALGAFLGTYVALGAVVATLGTMAPVRPVLWRTVLGALLVAVVGTVIGLRHHLAREDCAPSWREQLLTLTPRSVRRGVTVGLRGAAMLLLTGLVPVVALLATHLGAVRQVYTDLHPGVVGGSLLTGLQALLVPNLSAWGLSWLAGPGFGIGTGSSFTWTHSSSVLLPEIPLLGALPASGDQSPLWCLVGLVPVAVGAAVARAMLRHLSRLSAARAKVQAVVVAVLAAVAGSALALALSGGALGTRALADVGPHVVPASAALAAELAVGAGAVLGWSLWRFNRR